LGDFNDQGNTVADFLFELFADDDFKAQRDAKIVTCSSVQLEGDETLSLHLSHGESGVRSDLIDEDGAVVHEQYPDETQLIPFASVFELPVAGEVGWWGIHVNRGRSAKGILQKEIERVFRLEYGDFKLEIEPCVKADALRKALEEDKLQKVKLVSYGRARDFEDADEWVRDDTRAKVELTISPQERAKKLAPGQIISYLDGDRDRFGDIVEFEGLPFDEAQVEVGVNGSQRTFNIQNPEGGHAVSVEIEPTETYEEGVDLDDAIGEVLAVMREMRE
jgi:hypothetical protein